MDKKDREIEKDIEKEFSKKDLVRMLNGTTRQHIKLVKWLYDNHLKILREYEKAMGFSIKIHFAGGKDGSKGC